jgi:hypothetical protein
MKTIFVAGSWGSGTTALAGALHHLGVSSFGPFFRSRDPRTRNTFEWLPFRDVVLRHVDEETLSRKTGSDELVADLAALRDGLEAESIGSWGGGTSRNLLLKMPVASICLPEIVEVFDPRIVVVHRPFDDIERTRHRRSWTEVFGRKGAAAIYSRLTYDLIRLRKSSLALSYGDLVADTERALRSVVDFCGLHDLDANLGDACRFVRPDRPD